MMPAPVRNDPNPKPNLLSLTEKLFKHFKTFEKYDPSGFSLRGNNILGLDKISREFYDELAALYQLIKGTETMLGASIKYIALPLAEELREKLIELKGNFEKFKDHEKYAGYKLVSEVLQTWPQFGVAKEAAQASALNSNNN